MGAPLPVVLEGIYDGLAEDEAKRAFAECGYAPLATYVEKGHGKALRGYAERALVELADGTFSTASFCRAGCVCVCLSASLSVCLSGWLAGWLAGCLSVGLSVDRSVIYKCGACGAR